MESIPGLEQSSWGFIRGLKRKHDTEEDTPSAGTGSGLESEDFDKVSDSAKRSDSTSGKSYLKHFLY